MGVLIAYSLPLPPPPRGLPILTPLSPEVPTTGTVGRAVSHFFRVGCQVLLIWRLYVPFVMPPIVYPFLVEVGDPHFFDCTSLGPYRSLLVGLLH